MTTLAGASTRAIADGVRNAISRRASLRIVGSGTWLDAGRPVRATESFATRELCGIVDYVPGDLTLTARAGTTLAEIRDATSKHRQWLALDPHGDDIGTIGATIATGSAGPLSSSFGLPRDLVLGLEFVSGAGSIVRGGGRVVKNVAGFDLTRLLTGSWGTLGVITEVTMRLHARPEADVTIGVPLGSSAADVARVRQFLRRMPFAPYACEILNDAAASTVTHTGTVMALFRLGGNSEAVRAQRASLAEIGSGVELDPSAWTRLRSAEVTGAIVLRLSHLPSEIGAVWDAAMQLASACAGTIVHARPARGLVRCIVPNDRQNVASFGNHVPALSPFTCVPERLPAQLWRSFPSPAGDRLSARIKRTFDPDNVLNPGLLGEAS